MTDAWDALERSVTAKIAADLEFVLDGLEEIDRITNQTDRSRDA